MSVANLVSTSISRSSLRYVFNDDDDMLSVKRWLWLHLGRDLGPKLYVYGAIEGTFDRDERGAITIRMIGTTESAASGTLRSNAADVEHQLVINVYGRPDANPVTARTRTITLAQSVWRLLAQGSDPRRPLSIPLWCPGLHAELARSLRVLRPSLSMGIDGADDEGRWVRPIELRVRSPRHRAVVQAPSIQRITTR